MATAKKNAKKVSATSKKNAKPKATRKPRVRDFTPLTPKAITAARTAKELTQRELAKKIGYSQVYLCNVEKGHMVGSAKLHAKLASALGIKAD